MKPYIFGARNGIYIIDLQQTVEMFQTAYHFVVDTVAAGGNVAFCGDKETVPGGDQGRGGTLRDALCQPEMARRDVDELQHDQEEHRPAELFG